MPFIETTCPKCGRKMRKLVGDPAVPEAVKAVNVANGWGWKQESCILCARKGKRNETDD